MDNDATVTDTVADVKATATEPEQTADEPKKTEPEQKKVDADEIVKKLQKRIGAEQSKKNSYKEQLDNALKEIEKLKSGKSSSFNSLPYNSLKNFFIIRLYSSECLRGFKLLTSSTSASCHFLSE